MLTLLLAAAGALIGAGVAGLVGAGVGIIAGVAAAAGLHVWAES